MRLPSSVGFTPCCQADAETGTETEMVWGVALPLAGGGVGGDSGSADPHDLLGLCLWSCLFQVCFSDVKEWVSPLTSDA